MENRTPGTEMWRVEVSHFTTWNYNWSWGPPGDTEFPDMSVDHADKCDPCKERNVSPGSLVSDENIPIPGTGLTLRYNSDRVESVPAVIDVRASGDSVPGSLTDIKIRFEAAGQIQETVHPPIANTTEQFIWDGTDFQGRPAEGPVTAKVSVGYNYEGVYYDPAAFAEAFGQPGANVTANTAKGEVTLWETRTVQLNHAENTVADGWSVSAHHQMSPGMLAELLRGDGTTAERTVELIGTVAGNGDPSYSGDGGSAESAIFNRQNDVAFDVEGNMYVADMMNHRIRKINRNGIISTFSGTSNAGFSGDGGPAVNASLNTSTGVFVDSDGNLYIADYYNHRIRKVGPDCVITSIAGTGTDGYNGDEIPTVAAQLNYPADMSAADAGNLYIADEYGHRIRRIDSGGVIHTFAGMGVPNTYNYDPCSPVYDRDGNLITEPT